MRFSFNWMQTVVSQVINRKKLHDNIFLICMLPFSVIFRRKQIQLRYCRSSSCIQNDLNCRHTYPCICFTEYFNNWYISFYFVEVNHLSKMFKRKVYRFFFRIARCNTGAIWFSYIVYCLLEPFYYLKKWLL